MYPCPHCHQASFAGQQKLLTLWVRPTPCASCNKLSYLPVRNIIIALLVWTALSWVFIVTALLMSNVLYLFGSIPALLFAIDKWILQAPLQRFD